ncbi:unnamed protein product [Prunus armeniaca]|uniref:Major facilitator superfamily (MFS) profile domain-containing protein n=1 Tax=Prunus armeniaca TaxID=36596 RepID=A0A6J5WBC6_PRUAR|nr:unnamed protein product [Prunus armeniaca]
MMNNIASPTQGKPSRVVEVAQQFAFYGLASNLIMYLTNVLDQPLATAAKNVNTWLGVSPVFPVLRAFVADSYLGRFTTILFSITIYFMGMVLLTLSVSVIPSQSCRAVFFVALYILSVAQGGQKPCVQTFAADQFDENTPAERKAKSSFFNWWYLGLVFGATSATLGVVYLHDNVGWGLGFGILAGVLMVSLLLFLVGIKRYRKKRPPGSPFTTLAQVFVAAARKWHVNETLNCESVYYEDEKGGATVEGQPQALVLSRTDQLR